MDCCCSRKEKKETALKTTCCVCFEYGGDMSLYCNHIYHRGCLNNWRKYNLYECPMCFFH